MAKISHYVVTYNHETKIFEYDVETTLAHFPDGWIYNEETEEWSNSEDVTDYGNDVDGEDLLVEILNDHDQAKEDGSLDG